METENLLQVNNLHKEIRKGVRSLWFMLLWSFLFTLILSVKFCGNFEYELRN